MRTTSLSRILGAMLAAALAAPATAEIIGDPPTEATMAVAGTDEAGAMVSASVTLTWLMTATGMGDLTVAITNTSAEGTITAWGMMGGSISPSPQTSPYPGITISGTGDNAAWRFTNGIAGSGRTTNGVGPFGRFDFGGDTRSGGPIRLNSGKVSRGIAEGATGIFMFTGLSSPLLTAQAFFGAANANTDGLLMGFRYQATPWGNSAKLGKPPSDGSGVPEPVAVVLLCVGAVILAWRRR